MIRGIPTPGSASIGISVSDSGHIGILSGAPAGIPAGGRAGTPAGIPAGGLSIPSIRSIIRIPAVRATLCMAAAIRHIHIREEWAPLRAGAAVPASITEAGRQTGRVQIPMLYIIIPEVIPIVLAEAGRVLQAVEPFILNAVHLPVAAVMAAGRAAVEVSVAEVSVAAHAAVEVSAVDFRGAEDVNLSML